MDELQTEEICGGGRRLITGPPPAPAAPAKGPPSPFRQFEEDEVLETGDGRSFGVFHYTIDRDSFGVDSGGRLGLQVSVKEPQLCMAVSNVRAGFLLECQNETLPPSQRLAPGDFIGQVNGTPVKFSVPEFLSSLNQSSVTTLTVMREIQQDGHEDDECLPPPAKLWRGAMTQVEFASQLGGTTTTSTIRAADVGMPDTGDAYIWSAEVKAAPKRPPRGIVSAGSTKVKSRRTSLIRRLLPWICMAAQRISTEGFPWFAIRRRSRRISFGRSPRRLKTA